MSGDSQLTRKQIEVLLAAAGAAPSMHNTQPWRFDVTGNVIDVYQDPARTLPIEDPTGRATRIAIGAAVLNLRAAAAYLGYDSWFGFQPAGPSSELMARIVVAPSVAAVPPLGLLYAEIERRHTVRTPARDAEIPAGTRIELERVAYAEGAALHWLADEPLDQVLSLVVDADLRGVTDHQRTAERRHWIGGDRVDDGIPADALGPRSVSYPSAIRDLSATPREHQRRTARFEEHPLVAVLSTPNDAPTDQLTAGMALQRVLLTASRRGVSASFLNQALEYDDLRRRVQTITGEPGYAHMVIRFVPHVHRDPMPRRSVIDTFAKEGAKEVQKS